MYKSNNNHYGGTQPLRLPNFADLIKMSDINIEIILVDLSNNLKHIQFKDSMNAVHEMTINIDNNTVKIDNLLELLLIFFYIFNINAKHSLNLNDINSSTIFTEYIANVIQFRSDNENSTLKYIYSIMKSFHKFTVNSYDASASFYKDMGKLQTYIQALINSDIKLQKLYVENLRGIEGVPEKWYTLIEQLSKLQLLIFIKKIKTSTNTDDVVSNLIDALNGKMSIVNNILGNNIADGEYEDEDLTPLPTAPTITQTKQKTKTIDDSISKINELMGKVQNIDQTIDHSQLIADINLALDKIKPDMVGGANVLDRLQQPSRKPLIHNTLGQEEKKKIDKFDELANYRKKTVTSVADAVLVKNKLALGNALAGLHYNIIYQLNMPAINTELKQILDDIKLKIEQKLKLIPTLMSTDGSIKIDAFIKNYEKKLTESYGYDAINDAFQSTQYIDKTDQSSKDAHKIESAFYAELSLVRDYLTEVLEVIYSNVIPISNIKGQNKPVLILESWIKQVKVTKNHEALINLNSNIDKQKIIKSKLFIDVIELMTNIIKELTKKPIMANFFASDKTIIDILLQNKKITSKKVSVKAKAKDILKIHQTSSLHKPEQQKYYKNINNSKYYEKYLKYKSKYLELDI